LSLALRIVRSHLTYVNRRRHCRPLEYSDKLRQAGHRDAVDPCRDVSLGDVPDIGLPKGNCIRDNGTVTRPPWRPGWSRAWSARWRAGMTADRPQWLLHRSPSCTEATRSTRRAYRHGIEPGRQKRNQGGASEVAAHRHKTGVTVKLGTHRLVKALGGTCCPQQDGCVIAWHGLAAGSAPKGRMRIAHRVSRGCPAGISTA
jgi:hypothetical protein